MTKSSDSSVTLPALITPREAAALLSISPRKLWGMTASNEIPHIRCGRCVRYSVDDLRRWIERRREGGDR